jgi:predicted HicB family RNase H-like nuclease
MKNATEIFGTHHVGFRCSPDELQRIVDAARADERSVSSWIRKTLRDAIQNAGRNR